MLTTTIIGLLAGIAAVSLAGFLSARGAAQRRGKTKRATLAGRETVEVSPVRRDQESSGNRDNPDAMKTVAAGSSNDAFPLTSTRSR